MPILVCEKVVFYSLNDEETFFEFIRRIKAVRRFEGVGSDIVLHVAGRMSDASLRDLLAFFHRYRIRGMSQLARFATDANRHWFADPQKYWSRKVFGAPPRKNV